MPIRKAIVPVAGLGTRLLPFTKSVPKELIPIIDTPVIQYIVQEALDSGIEDIIFVSAARKQAVHNYFDYQDHLEEKKQDNPQVHQLLQQILSGTNFISVWQPLPKGLGNAILCAKSLIGNEPFAVFLPDDLIIGPIPCMRQLADTYAKEGHSIIGIMPVPYDTVCRYGIIQTTDPIESKKKTITALQEKPLPQQAYSNLAIIGRYILTPPIFECLQQTPAGTKGEVQLTDALSMLLKKEPLSGVLFEGSRFDTGDTLGWLQANVTLACQRSDIQHAFRAWLQSFTP